MRQSVWGAVATVLVAGGCAQVLGLGDYSGGEGGAATGTSSTSSTTSSSAASMPSSTTTSVTGSGSGNVTSSSTGAMCGNGVLEPPEKCDGDCPTECIDANLCTAQPVTGDPAMCTAECPFAEIIACKSWDGCCPATCFFGNDNDCDQRVAVLAGDTAGEMDLGDALTATGVFGSVTTLNIPFGTPAAMYPTLQDLDDYSAILVYTFSSFADPAAMGNVLADYVDAGGRVVLTAGANCADQYRLRGRFEADGYFLNGEGGVLTNPTALATKDEPMSPLLNGVDTLMISTHCDVMPTGATTVVATYADGRPLVLRGKRAGRNRVDLNLYAPEELFDATTIQLMVNALKYPRD